MAIGFLYMLKNGIKEKFKGIRFVLINKAFESFNKLKNLYVCIFMLVYYNLMHHIMLEYNMFRFAILMILLQLIKKTNQWHLVVFWLYKIAPAKQNYRVGELEMLAVVESYKQWRYYIKSAMYSI